MTDLSQAYTSAHAYASAHDKKAEDDILSQVLALQHDVHADPSERLAALKTALAKIDQRRRSAAA